MPLTRTSSIRLIRIAAIIAIAAIIIGYAIWRSLNYARGPEIDISSPADASAVSSSTVTIDGRALRVDSLSLDGDPISLDQQGGFSQTVIVFPGENRLTFSATDQFGRSISKELDLVGTGAFPSSAIPNGTTPSSTASSTTTASTTGLMM